MKLKLGNMLIDCGCDKRRKKLVNWFNGLKEEKRLKLAGKRISFGRWIYEIDNDGVLVSEKERGDKTSEYDK